MKHLNPAIVRQQIDSLLLAFPELAEDEILRRDMLEAETDLTEYLREIERKREEAEALENALQLTMNNLKDRRERFERREKAMRALMFSAMQWADLRRLEMPEATLSIANGKSKVVIVDEAALPKECLRIKTEPDKTVIKTMLDNFETVPGACLSNPEPHLMIRTK